MTHQNVVRVSGRVNNPSIGHILQALFQAQQDGASEVTFARSCRSISGEFRWSLEGRDYVISTEGISGTEVRKALLALTGLDQSGEFPREADLVLEIPKSEFIQEFPVDEKYITPENITWRQIGWRVSFSSSEGPITLRRTG